MSSRHASPGVFTNSDIMIVSPGSQQLAEPPAFVPPAPTPSLPAAATPVILPIAGTYVGTLTVTITDASVGATIYYTTDGSTPTTASTVYSGSFTVSTDTTVKTLATGGPFSDSPVASNPYFILLVTSPTVAAADLFGFFDYGPSGLTAITIANTHIIPGVDIENDTGLTSVSLPNLIDIDPTNTQGGYLQVSGCTSLTVLSMPVFVPTNGNSYSLNGNAFSAATVNAILARFVANAGFVSGTINISGGTSSAPTGQGATDKATLIGRGVTVTTN